MYLEQALLYSPWGFLIRKETVGLTAAILRDVGWGVGGGSPRFKGRRAFQRECLELAKTLTDYFPQYCLVSTLLPGSA